MLVGRQYLQVDYLDEKRTMQSPNNCKRNGGAIRGHTWMYHVGYMVIMSRDSAAQTLHNISRDMMGGILPSTLFSARSPVVSTGGAP